MNEIVNKKLRKCKKILVNISIYGIIHFSGDTTCFQFIHNYVKILKTRGRKNKMKKRLALVLATTMALSVFAMGCGSDEGSTDETTTKAAATTTAPADTTTAPAEDTTAAPEETTEAPAADATTYKAETLTLGAWWTGWSTEYYKIADGQTMTIKVKGTTNADIDNEWSNWVMVLANAERGGEGYAESIVLRADKHGWGTDYKAENLKFTLNGEELAQANFGKATDADLYAKWLADGKAGLDSTIEIKRTGADFTYTATSVCGDNTWVATATWTTTAALADDMLVFLTGEQCTLDIQSVEVK